MDSQFIVFFLMCSSDGQILVTLINVRRANGRQCRIGFMVNMSALLALTLLFILRIGESSILSEIQLNGIDPSTQLFVNATREILKSFYVNATTTVYITVGSETNEIREILGETIKTENLPLSYVIEKSEYVSDEKHRRYFNMFVVDTYESFQ